MKESYSMKLAAIVWAGPPDDPLEYAWPCPHCGELPEWERDGKFSTRHRLNCCGINDGTRGYYIGHEVAAVIAWNAAVEWEKEAIAWAQEEEKQEARHAADDAWADANLMDVA